MSVLSMNVYKKQIVFESEFRSASGSVSKKETLFFVFSADEQRQFVYEAALSPSLGESVADVCARLAAHESVHQVLPECRTLVKAISFARMLVACDFNLEKLFGCRAGMPEYLAETIGIGDHANIGNTSNPSKLRLLKLKGSLDNLERLIALSKTIEVPWIVDFNRSLTEREWIKFCAEVDFAKGVFVEQPFPAGVMKSELAKRCHVPVFADEELNSATPEICAEMGFGGIILKTIRHTAPEIFRYASDARRNDMQFTFGTMLCDAVDNSFAQVLSRFSNVSWSSGEPHSEQVYDVGSDERLILNQSALDAVLEGAELIAENLR